MSRERAAAAASGDPVTPSMRPGGSMSGSEDFGRTVVTRGDVSVFSPVREGDGLRVPLKITNTGSGRAVYRVDVRVTGPGGFDARVSMETGTVGVYPGASWPTELTFTDPGKPVPDHPRVSIVKSTREVLRG
ncbi:hypothetical protein HW130_01620 [Streptomyces sp. PKU-EA00015]|uniref:hypothetical protein n=1 Tax=Streptomyces sp. PKU-EA00015 TaxID=2748326 RepID=UPI0015A1F306|nr:hypothetical protein [Streptomyces sp. PKU-EA00015]NWF24968.1 hypothetical protein [Streptomyces sp. PKU-EA00015]